MVKVFLKGGKEKKYAEANVCGMHPTGNLLQVSRAEDGGTGFRRETQIAIIPTDQVQRVEITDAPEITISN